MARLTEHARELPDWTDAAREAVGLRLDLFRHITPSPEPEPEEPLPPEPEPGEPDPNPQSLQVGSAGKSWAVGAVLELKMASPWN